MIQWVRRQHLSELNRDAVASLEILRQLSFQSELMSCPATTAPTLKASARCKAEAATHPFLVVITGSTYIHNCNSPEILSAQSPT